jgi:hypothetical protein
MDFHPASKHYFLSLQRGSYQPIERFKNGIFIYIKTASGTSPKSGKVRISCSQARSWGRGQPAPAGQKRGQINWNGLVFCHTVHTI